MQMSGEHRIPAPRQKVWEALNDPDILGQCIPGCQSIEKVADNEMKAEVKAKVGPVSAKFKADVTMEDVNAPESYTLKGEGKGAAAGFAKGEARVSLAEDGEETVLSYEVDAKVGGKLQQVGARLINSTATKMADEFFAKFSTLAAGGAETAAEAPAEQPAAAEEPNAKESEQGEKQDAALVTRERRWTSPLTIVITVIALALLAYWIFAGS